MGWQLVRHSLLMVWRNRIAALKVSIGPMLIGSLAILLFGQVTGLGVVDLSGLLAPGAGAMEPGAATMLLVSAVLYFGFVSWVMVAWHRLVLLEEYPGLLPPMMLPQIGAYIWKSITVALALMLAMVPVSLAGMATVVFLGLDQTAVGQVGLAATTYCVLGYLSLRISAVLPAAAVGRPLTIRGAWAATSALSPAMFAALLMFLMLGLVLSGSAAWALGDGPLRVAAELAISWVTMMAGASLLTTIYGIAVEGRKIG